MRAFTAGLLIQHHAIFSVHLRSPCQSLPWPIIPLPFLYVSFSSLASCGIFACFYFSYLFFISSLSLLLQLMLWVKHASQSLVGRTVSIAYRNLSLMKTCNSYASSSAWLLLIFIWLWPFNPAFSSLFFPPTYFLFQFLFISHFILPFSIINFLLQFSFFSTFCYYPVCLSFEIHALNFCTEDYEVKESK